MKKKFFNLAVAMSVIASSLCFSSCGDDEDEDEPQKTENTTTDDTTKDESKPSYGEASTSVKVAKGESYKVSNANVGTSTMYVVDVTSNSITVEIFGDEVTIGTGELPSYALYVSSDMKVKAVSQADAKADPANVLFICNSNMELASATTAKDATIKSGAAETTFAKQN